eukprot:TRINITY_DN9412_c0_g1_i1.p1 TRINITY_DN9412_c0_g1~~TRINITY_DN9412_c0_g1_i1.p1  ORF type:complete len:459 (-),score=30.27 TRINITY_DN9412_c0_g1_i1:2-1378(-)
MCKDNKFFCLIFLLLAICCTNGLKWRSVVSPQWQELNSFAYVGNKLANFTTFYSIVLPLSTNTGEISACKRTSSMVAAPGAIFLFAYGGGCSVEKHVQLVEELGGVGAIVLADNWTACNMKDFNYKDYNSTVPAICVDYSDLKVKNFVNGISLAYSVNQSFVQVEFQAGINPFSSRQGKIVFYRIWVLLNLCILILLCSGRLGLAYFYEGAIFNLCKISLIMIILTCITCIVFFVDPFGYFGVIPYFQVGYTFYLLQLMFFIPVQILVSNYFAPICFRLFSLPPIVYYLYYGWCTIMICLVEAILIADIALISDFNQNNAVNYATQVIVLIITGVCILVFFAGSSVVIQKLRKFSISNSSNARQKISDYTRILISVILIMISDIVCFVSLAVITKGDHNNEYFGFMGLVLAYFTGAIFTMYGVVFLFKLEPHLSKQTQDSVLLHNSKQTSANPSATTN